MSQSNSNSIITSTPSISRSSSSSSQKNEEISRSSSISSQKKEEIRTSSVDNSTPPNPKLGLDFDKTSTELDFNKIPTDLTSDQSNSEIKDNQYNEDNISNEVLVLTRSMMENSEITSIHEKDTILPNNQANTRQKRAQNTEIIFQYYPNIIRRKIESNTKYSNEYIHNEYSLSEEDETKVKETIENNKANIKCSKKNVENGQGLHCIGQLIGRSFALQQNKSFLNELGEEYSIEVDKLKQAIKNTKSSLSSIWEQEPNKDPAALTALIKTIKAEKNIDINIDSLKRKLSSHRKNTVIEDGLTNTAKHIQKHFDNLGNNTIDGYTILYDETHNGYCILTPQNEKIGIKPQSVDENGKITWQMATYINDINIQDELNNANITQLTPKDNPFYSGDQNSISIESAFLVFSAPDEILEDAQKCKTNLLNNMDIDQLAKFHEKLKENNKVEGHKKIDPKTIYNYLSEKKFKEFAYKYPKMYIQDMIQNYKDKCSSLNPTTNNNDTKIKNSLQKCWHIINRLKKPGQATSYLARLVKILSIEKNQAENLKILLKDLKEKNKQLKTH